MCKWSAIPKGSAVTLSPATARAVLAQILVCETMGVGLAALQAQDRGDRQAALARHIAMYLCRLVFAMRLSEIALSFGRDRTTAAYAVQRIEEARENLVFDAFLCWLEWALLRLACEIEEARHD